MIYALGDTNVYGLISPGHSFLIKSNDGGHTWDVLPGLDEHQLYETFGFVAEGDNLFIFSTDKGVFRSIDGGCTFEKMLPVPDVEEGRASMIWDIDVTTDISGRPVILAATYYGRGRGGLWILNHPYDAWEDLRVGNAESGTKCQVLRGAFSPTYATDKQIIALTGDLQSLRVTTKYGDEDWGKRIADAYIPDASTACDLPLAGVFAFPDDYDSQFPIFYIGTCSYTEHLCRTPQYADLYRIEGKPPNLGLSTATDLDVAGKGTSTPVISAVVKGPADNATILAGGIGQVYRSVDGGDSWQGAEKPPTGGLMLVYFDPAYKDGSVVYCMSTSFWNVLVPRGADVPIGESAFSRSVDGGITWNQISLIDTTIDETIGKAVSPNYSRDDTMFILTRSQSTLPVSLNEEENIAITREPNTPGVSAEVIVVVHGANPPGERIKIDDREYVAGTGPKITLNDECSTVSCKVLPLLEQPGMDDLLQLTAEKYGQWYVDQYLALCEQPRQAIIYVLYGSVSVTKGEQVEGTGGGSIISVDGDARDWQGIEPLATDPEGDAPSKNEDMKAFYMTNDREHVYFMVEFYGQDPQVVCHSALDVNLDGEEDYSFTVEFHQGEYVRTHIFGEGKPSRDTFIGEDEAGLGTVLEGRISLPLIGNPEEFRINWIRIETGVEGKEYVPDEWDGSFEVKMEEFVAPSDLVSIPFPSTESLWKTADSGNTWERILTSGLKLLADGTEMEVGPLESMALSDNFAEDNTLFLYESGDEPKIWVSTDGGATFAIQQ